jgi:hypothetical protein
VSANFGALFKGTLMNAAAAVAPVETRPLRSFGAVFAGLFFIFFLSSALDAVLHATGVYPPVGAPPMSDALFALAFGYRFVIDVAGCCLTAKLAPSKPMKHALILGAVGLALSIAGAAAMWGAGPAWYPIGLALSSLRPRAALTATSASRETSRRWPRRSE